MNDLSEKFEWLQKELRTLEQRLGALDHRLERVESRVGGLEQRPLAVHSADLQLKVEAPAPTAASESRTPAGSFFPIVGKALLGIAGAYVLRAIEESSAIPRLIVAIAGILYAFLWLIGAARVRKGPRAASAIHACTSALILAPMLWELTLRFGVLSATTSALVVCGFALVGFALTWKSGQNAVVRIAAFAAVALALALAVASHELLPFVVALLLLTALCEFVPGCDCLPDVAALFALAADALIWALIYVYFAGTAAHEDFPALNRGALLAPGLALFVVFAVSLGIKTLLRARPITAFETIQTSLAFLLAAVSVADFAEPYGPAILGIACLVLSGVCYAAVFTVFARASAQRNRNIFATWSATLLLVGVFLCLPRSVSSAMLVAAALASAWIGRQERWRFFAFYSMAFLLGASFASGLFGILASAFVGTTVGLPAPAVWLTAACAPFCYRLAARSEVTGRFQQLLHLAFAALAAVSAAALLAGGLIALTALRVIPGAHHLALIRTIVLCAAALALVYGGTRWQRRELTGLGYSALAVVAVKLIAEDLRHGHLAYIAASIFLVAFTLIAAPRMARTRPIQ